MWLRWQDILGSDGLLFFVQQRRDLKSAINSTTRGLSKELRERMKIDSLGNSGLDDLFHWYDNKKDVAVKIAEMEI